MSSKYVFSDETQKTPVDIDDRQVQGSFKVLIVDDDKEVHQVSLLAMKKITFDGCGLVFLHAYSGAEARLLIRDNPDIAIIFLDVVMEEDDAGLKVVEYIRNELQNPFPRIVLRTGEPGRAPERKIIYNYDINDYREKTDLSVDKLYTLVISALRAYQDMIRLDRSRKGMSQLIKATNSLFLSSTMDQFISCLLNQVLTLTGMEEPAFLGHYSTFFSQVLNDDEAPKGEGKELSILCGTGQFQDKVGHSVESVIDKDIFEKFEEVRKFKKGFYNAEYRFMYLPNQTHDSIIYIEGSHNKPDSLQIHLLEILASEASAAYSHVKLSEELTQSQKEVIFILGSLAEFRSNETGTHITRVSLMAKKMAQIAGHTVEEVEIIELASAMHDIGKVGIPDSILHKKGKLESDEFDIMKTHCRIGFECLDISDSALLSMSAIIAYQHQEKWDGSGYPQGLSGEAIHPFARIVSIIDVYDALSHKRSYKEAWDKSRIIDYFKAERGKQFEPILTDMFLENYACFESIVLNNPD